MFSSKPRNTASAAPSPAPSPASHAAKRPGRSTVPSIISGDLNVTGALVSDGDIQVEGIVDGDVRSVGLVVGEKAQIRGEILAEDVTVRGRVIGRIRARKVQLAATAHVEGDILHETFSVEVGAFFEGNCRRSDDALSRPSAGDETRQLLIPASPIPASSSAAQPALARTGLAGLTPVGAAE
ncbi:MAG TPA: polymer-forming cytoskeletal protein [Rhizomicrobium sp.]|nr:polymer-forming cytoskeletal protein [Rhizomicrobium sp.]